MPLSRPIPAPPDPPEAERVPSGSLPLVWSMRREVPSPREIPAQPSPLSKMFSVPRLSSRVTSLAFPRLKARPTETLHSTPSKVSDTGPRPSSRTIRPLKGCWLASTPAPPEMAVTWALRMYRVWVSSS